MSTEVRYPFRGRVERAHLVILVYQRNVLTMDPPKRGIASVRPVQIFEFNAKPVQRIPYADAAQEPGAQVK